MFAAAVLATALAGPALGAATARAATAEEECDQERASAALLAKFVAASTGPTSGTELAQGSTALLSAASPIAHNEETHRVEELPLSFAVSASTEVKTFKIGAERQEVTVPAHPYVDNGAGVPGAETETSRSYTFSSTAAAEQIRTVYWDVSFSLNLEKCHATETFYTSAQALKVVPSGPSPAPPPAPEAPPAAGSGSSNGRTTSFSPPAASGLRVGITAARKLALGRRNGFAYLVDCTTTCTGTTSIQAWILRKHKKPVRAGALGFRSRKVSIAGAKGGDERFNVRYRRGALRKLRAALRHHGKVKLEVTASVKEASGKSVTVHRTILLHG